MRHETPDGGTPELDALDDALVRAGETTRPPCRWRPKLIGALTALAVAVVAAAASYGGASYAYSSSAAHTDDRIAVLEGDLSQRRASALAANANRDAQIAQLKRLVCILADHAQPRDDQVAQVRAEFACTGGPYPEPPLPTVTPTR